VKCDDCTLCCKLLDVFWMDSPAGKWCRHCDPKNGCKIYNLAIPQRCKEYKCAYNAMEKCNPSLRPNNCHVIFERIGENKIMFGLVDPDYDINSVVGKQIKAFLKDGFSVVIHRNGTFVVHRAKGVELPWIKQEVKKRMEMFKNDRA